MATLTSISLFALDASKNCTAAVKLAAAPGFTSGSGGFNYDDLVSFAISCGPPHFMNATPSDILAWYLEAIDHGKNLTRITAVAWQIREKCQQNYCQALRWSGNPDLAGIGVFVANYTEALIATAFLAGYMYHIMIMNRATGPLSFTNESFTRRPAWTAIQSTSNLFWHTALLFAFASNTASLVIIYTDGPSNSHTLIFASLTSTFVTSAVTMLWQLCKPTSRSIVLRRACHILVTLMGGTVVAAAQLLHLKKGVKADAMQFEGYCMRGPWALTTSGCVLGIAFFLFWIIGSSIRFWCGRTVKGSLLGPAPKVSVNSILELTPTILSAMLMWWSLAMYTYWRNRVGNAAGPSFEDNTWTFGQVIAVITWAPIPVDFLRVWKGGRKGLTKRLPKGLKIKTPSV